MWNWNVVGCGSWVEHRGPGPPKARRYPGSSGRGLGAAPPSLPLLHHIPHARPLPLPPAAAYPPLPALPSTTRDRHSFPAARGFLLESPSCAGTADSPDYGSAAARDGGPGRASAARGPFHNFGRHA